MKSNNAQFLLIHFPVFNRDYDVQSRYMYMLIDNITVLHIDSPLPSNFTDLNVVYFNVFFSKTEKRYLK